MFDNFCDLDVWIIKERSSVDCEGACFKWQQIVNNSGSFSYMTLRACYASMFDSNDPATAPESEESYCSSRSTSLDCLTDANVIEDFCWCQGDYCNGATAWKLSSNFISMLVLLYLLAFS
ncbi:unnamed protein product [Toxocara canis]|uniref:LNR domain-containing protein n=1 Tax=Toxocara canis TaxID=6265 RepID=A0A183V296_TOXCA|nr:unnamed protein product [Toxocara canis]